MSGVWTYIPRTLFPNRVRRSETTAWESVLFHLPSPWAISSWGNRERTELKPSVQAWLNVCPHAGRRMNYAPGLFLVKDDKLTCAVHGSTFALRDGGLCISGPCRGQSLVAVRVKVQNGVVMRG